MERDRVIEVRSLDGQSTKVSVSSNCSVADMKELLKESFLPAKESPNFHLFFKGTKLSLETRLSSLSIESGDFFVLVSFVKKTQRISAETSPLEDINSNSSPKPTERTATPEASDSAWHDIMDDLLTISDILPDNALPTNAGASDNLLNKKEEVVVGESSSRFASRKRQRRDTLKNPMIWDIFCSGSTNVFDQETCDGICRLVDSVNCLSDSHTGNCLLFDRFFRTADKVEDCVCSFWLKKVLKAFTFINILYGFCRLKRKCLALEFLEKALKQACSFGLDNICISDVENLSKLCPKVVIMLGKEESLLVKSNSAIIIGDASTVLANKHESADKPRAASKRASISATVNAVEKIERSFKADLWKAIKISMEKTMSETKRRLLSLEDVLISRKDHVPFPKGSEAKLIVGRPRAFGCRDKAPLEPTAMIDHLRMGLGMYGQIVHVEKTDGKLAVHADIPGDLSDASKAVLKGLGISRLYSHQAEAIRALVSGKDVVVATSTSSGKSLCYNLPVLEDLCQKKSSCALYIFPTKALAQDQLRALLQMTRSLGVSLDVGVYDGDTSQEDRMWIKDSARLLLTNPDMIHMSILPYHRQFQRILTNLRFIVMDEAHTYKGAFGCHVALILRRLRRICSHVYGNQPSFMFCTATSANPREHAMELANMQGVELIQNDGSPSGPKYCVLWNPPLTLIKAPSSSSKNKHEEATTKRLSPILEVSYLFAEMVQHGLRCIAFCKTRKLCELVLCYTREVLRETAPMLVDTICAYRAGYTPQDRRKIEADLFEGRLQGIAATNALELGIDVGHIDATLHLGFPGSVASLWQQAGRSGRRGRPSLAIYVAFEGPLDQYFMRFPHKLFQRPIEHVQIDADNEKVLEQHVACAAVELPLCLQHDERHFGSGLRSAVESLKKKGCLISDSFCVSSDRFWSYIGSEENPSLAVGIRAIEQEKYKVLDKKTYEILEEIEESRAFFQVYEGAIYMHQGRTYLVSAIDLSLKMAFCLKADVQYYTKTRDYTDIHVIGANLAYPQVKLTEQKQARTTAQANNCTVTTNWFGFYRISRASNCIIESVELNLPSYSYESQAAWIRVPQSVTKDVEIQELSVRAGQHAASHALLNVVPLYITCNASDLKTECAHPRETRNVPQRILLFDQHPGGIGIALKVQVLFRELLTAALELVTTCSCSSDAGCPNCIQAFSCSEYNEVLDKKAAIIILKGVIEAENQYFGNTEASTHL